MCSMSVSRPPGGLAMLAASAWRRLSGSTAAPASAPPASAVPPPRTRRRVTPVIRGMLALVSPTLAPLALVLLALVLLALVLLALARPALAAWVPAGPRGSGPPLAAGRRRLRECLA